MLICAISPHRLPAHSFKEIHCRSLVRRIGDVGHYVPRPRERPLNQRVIGMLGFDGATKRFGSLAALDRCTFTARPGRFTGFLGPNGAGKTTAMRAVFGLVELDAGTVRWRGVSVSAAERARFGYMPEERGPYPRMRVRDQLVYLGQLCGRGAKDVGRSVDRWLERLGLTERAGDRLDALSHGNQQRVQLIAALVNDPDLLDDPQARMGDASRQLALVRWRGDGVVTPGITSVGTEISPSRSMTVQPFPGGANV